MEREQCVGADLVPVMALTSGIRLPLPKHPSRAALSSVTQVDLPLCCHVDFANAVSPIWNILSHSSPASLLSSWMKDDSSQSQAKHSAGKPLLIFNPLALIEEYLTCVQGRYIRIDIYLACVQGRYIIPNIRYIRISVG